MNKEEVQMTILIRNVLSNKGWGVTTVPPAMPLLDLIDLLVGKRIGATPVVDGSGTVLGLVSERDVVNGIAAHHDELASMKAGDVMSSPAVTASPDDPLMEGMRLMTVHRNRHIPVVEDGKLVGLLSIGDVVKYRLDEAEFELDAMRAYVTQTNSGQEQIGGGAHS